MKKQVNEAYEERYQITYKSSLINRSYNYKAIQNNKRNQH